MNKNDDRVIFYIDDIEDNISAFRTTCEVSWHSEFTVASNETFGKIDTTNFDVFKVETFKLLNEYRDNIECVLLDLDYSGEKSVSENDSRLRVGFMLGRLIRKNWPFIPIFVSSRFSCSDITEKGLLYDFEYVAKPEDYNEMSYNNFIGILEQAKKKRHDMLANLPNVPVSYLSKTHTYFSTRAPQVAYDKLVFIAMPFDDKVVNNDTKKAITEAIESCGMASYKVDEVIFNDSIIDKIACHIFNCKIFIADITTMNPNVMYELGLAMSTNKKCVIIKNVDQGLDLPFDLRSLPIIGYSTGESADLKNKLIQRIKSSLY